MFDSSAGFKLHVLPPLEEGQIGFTLATAEGKILGHVYPKDYDSPRTFNPDGGVFVCHVSHSKRDEVRAGLESEIARLRGGLRRLAEDPPTPVTVPAGRDIFINSYVHFQGTGCRCPQCTAKWLLLGAGACKEADGE